MRLLFLLCWLPFWVNAQNKPEYVRWLPTSKIQLHDFKRTPILPDRSYAVAYQLGYSISPVRSGQSALVTTACYWDKNLSWIEEPYRNEQTLHYLQTYLELAGLYERILKNQLIITVTSPILYRQMPPVADSIYYALKIELAQQASLYELETELGTDSEAVDRWQNAIRQRQGALPNLTAQISLADIGLGCVFPVGLVVPTKQLGQSLQLLALHGIESNLGYKQVRLLLSMGLLYGQTKQAFAYKSKVWPSDLDLRGRIGEVSLGLVVAETKRSVITGFAGYQHLVIYALNSDKDPMYDEHRFRKASLTVGFLYDYRILLTSRMVMPGYHVFLRAKASVTPVALASPLRGNLFQFHLGLGLYGYAPKLRYYNANSPTI